jgi:hypothetical protein
VALLALGPAPNRRIGRDATLAAVETGLLMVLDVDACAVLRMQRSIVTEGCGWRDGCKLDDERFLESGQRLFRATPSAPSYKRTASACVHGVRCGGR